MRIPALAVWLAATLVVPPMGAEAQAAAVPQAAEDDRGHVLTRDDIVAQESAGERPSQEASPPATTAEKKRGRGKWLLIAGGVAVVGAAAILIATRDQGSCLACGPPR